MKPIFKVLSKPFRSTKSKKSIQQQTNKNHNDKQIQIEDFQKNIDHQKGIKKDIEKSSFFYSQIEKMVDQLGSMLHFKEKMTQQQKRQLIYQLSSMAMMNQKRPGTQLMDEDVLSDNDEDCQQQIECDKKTTENKQNLKQGESEAATRSSSQTSPKNQQSPQKQLKDMFEQFEHQQQKVVDSKVVKPSLSTYSEIKSQISKFWVKNATKVIKLMKPKKEQKSSKNNVGSKSQHQIPDLSPSKKVQKKKNSIIGSIFPSWNGKKSQKLNSTDPVNKEGKKNEIQQKVQEKKDQVIQQKQIKSETNGINGQFSIDGEW